jgi:flagellar hook protein FlgE
MDTLLMTADSGLEASQQMLNVAGNNLANSNTTGFKAQTVQFSDLVYQTLQPGTGVATGLIGGTDPEQIGQGVQVASIDSDMQQGTLESTGNQLDVALQGNGFFVANNGSQVLYTRAGSFGVNNQNVLVDPATGYAIQRFGDMGEGTATTPAFQTAGNDDIQIPYNTTIPGQATSTVTVQGNLSATTVGPQAEVLTSAQPFSSAGAPANSNTLLNSLTDNAVPYVTGDSIQIQGTTVNGTAVSTTLSVGPTTTLGNVLSAINGVFTGSTATLDANGNIVLQANNAGPGQLSMVISDVAGNTGSTPWANHDMAITTPGSAGGTVTTGIQFYDSQGTAHTMTLTFQQQGNNTWNMTGSLPQGGGTMVTNTVTGITFNSNGSFSQVTGASGGTPSLTVQIPGIATPQQINFSLGSPNGFNGLTQEGTSSSVAATNQDGYTAGSLNSLTIDQDGTINGVFTNGQTLPIAQLAIANFANVQGLSRDGGNYFSATVESGAAQVGAAESGGLGTVNQGSLETSNVDVSVEFTNLIIAQRAFDLNAQAVTIGNQVLQALASIAQ